MRELLTVEEAAAELRLSYKTVLELCQRGELPACRFGGQWRIDAEAMREMCRGEAVTPAL